MRVGALLHSQAAGIEQVLLLSVCPFPNLPLRQSKAYAMYENMEH